MQKIGATVDEKGITFEMEGAASTLTSLLSALIAKFAKQMEKAGGTYDMWIDTIAQSAKEAVREGNV